MLFRLAETAFGPHDITIKSAIPGRLRASLSPRAYAAVRPHVPLLVDMGLASSIDLNDRIRSVLIHYDPASYSSEEFISALLLALGLDPEAFLPASQPAAAHHPLPRTVPAAAGWTLRSDIPGRFRASHPFLRAYPQVAQAIETTLINQEGVTGFSVERDIASVLVTYDVRHVTRERVVAALLDTMNDIEARFMAEGKPESDVELNLSTLQLGASTLAMGLSVASYAFPLLRPAAFAATALAGGHIVISAAKSIVQERKLRVDVLDATVITLALYYRHLLPAGLMVWVVDVSNVLLEASSRAQRKTLSEMFGRQVRRAWQLIDDVEVGCLVSDLQQGDLIIVRSGEQIPVDGTVVDGEALIDQSALSGEHVPVEKTSGERVMAMTIVHTGRIVVRVEETGENTNAARLVRIIEQSLEHRVRLQSMTERFADMMVVPTLSLGGLGYGLAGPGAMMAVINADFGTGIRIAGPLAMLASLSAAAKQGILVKNGGVLERITQIDAVVFDKTGTLTEEEPIISEVWSVEAALSDDDILALVAAAEQRFTHPIAKAVLREAAARGLELPEIDETEYKLGFGIQVSLDGEFLKVGSRRYMDAENIPLPPEAAEIMARVHEQGGSVIFAALGEQLIGLLALQARPRAEAMAVIRTLREQRGIQEIYLISGDHEAPTRALAHELGIENYFAEVLPQDKARYVKQLQDRGLKVAMVGDGINDTVGLSQADFSISLRGAADAATDVADIVMMDGNLAKLDLLFEISANLRRNVQRSFILTLVPNSICIAGALVGFFGLGHSLVLNNAFNLVTTANGLNAQAPLRRYQPATLPPPEPAVAA